MPERLSNRSRLIIFAAVSPTLPASATLFLWLMALAALGSSALLCAQEHDEEDPFLSGLIAKYSDSAQHSFRRRDEAIAFHWNENAPDSRIAADHFEVYWRGKLYAQGAGEYRLAVHVSGEVEIKLAGKVAIPKQKASGWVFSELIALEFDRHELEVRFRKTKNPAHVSLYWSGPQFGLEPVSPRHLVHDKKESFQNLYERGEILAAGLRCVACHRQKADPQPLPAPSLLHAGGNLREDWLRLWLSENGQQQDSIHRRMPSFGLSEDEAKAIGAYLDANPPARESPRKPGGQSKPSPSAAKGERLVLTLGCLACHQVHELGESGLFGGGDLSKVASKRPAPFFGAWLAEPAKLNPDHRMPVFELNQDERASLSLYLATLGTAEKSARQDRPATALVTAGRKLVSTHRCASCHALAKDPELPGIAAVQPLGEKSDWTKSCADTLDSSRARLGYGLTKADQQALQEFFSAPRVKSKKGDNETSGRLTLIQNNCLACHGREGIESLSTSLPKKLADKLAALAQQHPDLAASVPAMTPPSLNGIGDKFPDQALAATIRRQDPPLRDYLLVRMPRFPLPDEELKRLTNYFIQTDRIPPLPAAAIKPTFPEETAYSLAGSRLVSADGFGCTSCHQVGKVIPDKAPLNARGPSLSLLDKRVRKEWYDRFLRNPARIVPRMEMPSVQIPVRGVLEGKLEPQLAALWHVLATPGFEPPEPNPFRVLRMAGGPSKEQPQIVLDTVYLQNAVFTKPLLVAFSNRHNLLFDLETNRLVAWTIGDTASQRTKGKSWFWRSEGHNLMVNRLPVPEISLIVNGKEAMPLVRDQVLAQPLRMSSQRAASNGHFFQYSLAFQVAESQTVVRLLVTQYLTGQADPDDPSRTSVTRDLFITGAPEGSKVLFRALNSDAAGSARWEKHAFRFDERQKTMIRVEENKWQDVSSDGTVVASRHDADQFHGMSERGIRIRVEYSTKFPVDRFDVGNVPELRADAGEVEMGDGLRGRRLPLPLKSLPTALVFQPDGSLVVGTLTGKVFLAVDAHPQDGLEETIYSLADGLPAPYGLHATDVSVEVLTKTNLIRVPAPPDHGSTTFVASGWGHTIDYHDWAIGLPRNDKGEYYLGLPCQQDERSVEGAKYRGTVARLVPRKSTKDDSHEYAIEPLSSGHRFPMGLAVNRDGDLFVTDNQGNYNPFNELNHVRKGAFFGFVNAIDKKNKDYKAPPTTEPAINIPHPWTRSVNGICFLYTPEKLKKETGKEAFGPLEGQLVGCEYDTRRLIRMSLQKIGETYQGCAYPLSQEPSSPEKGFLGPIVCAVSPRGELYVGSIRESGWGAGNNVGEIVKIKFEPEKLPCGIAEVKAMKGGFSIDFLKEVDAKKAADIANYSISSYRRISTPTYGGPDVDRRIEKIDSVELSADRRRVTVQLPELRTGGFVYEIQLKNIAPADAEFFPTEAYFTLHGVP
jgi:mono/diheme cytochrome c family protein